MNFICVGVDVHASVCIHYINMKFMNLWICHELLCVSYKTHVGHYVWANYEVWKFFSFFASFLRLYYKISVQQMVIMSSSAGHMHAYFKEYLYYCDFYLKVYIATHGFTYI